jgi:prevent-host-death family protein
MKTVDIQDAKTQLSRLIERVQAGEEIVIAKAGRPVARLVPLEVARKLVKIGGLKPPTPFPADFNTMFEEEIAALFAGRMGSRPTRRRKLSKDS